MKNHKKYLIVYGKNINIYGNKLQNPWKIFEKPLKRPGNPWDSIENIWKLMQNILKSIEIRKRLKRKSLKSMENG